MKEYTVGIDFGSLSGRAVLMHVKTGEILSSAVYEYPHAVMDEQLPDGTKLPLNTALQHPAEDDAIAQQHCERAIGHCAHHFTVELPRAVVAQPIGWSHFGRLHSNPQTIAIRSQRITCH